MAFTDRAALTYKLASCNVIVTNSAFRAKRSVNSSTSHMHLGSGLFAPHFVRKYTIERRIVAEVTHIRC